MADFHLWSKESLVKFAEDATLKLAEYEETAKNLHLAWRAAVAKPVPSATLTPQQPSKESP